MFLDTGDEFLLVWWDWKAQMDAKNEQEAYDLGMNFSQMVPQVWSDAWCRIFCTKKLTPEQAQELHDLESHYDSGSGNVYDIIEELDTQYHYRVINGDLEYDKNATSQYSEGDAEVKKEQPEAHQHIDTQNASDFLKDRGKSRWQNMLDFVKKQGFHNPEEVVAQCNLDDISDFEGAMNFYYNRIPQYFIYTEFYEDDIELQMTEKTRIKKIIAQYILDGFSLAADDIVVYDLDKKEIINWEVKNIDVLVE
jgi:hypothetical protein